MAHPKRKISKTRRDKRRTHYKASESQVEGLTDGQLQQPTIITSVSLREMQHLVWTGYKFQEVIILLPT